MGNHNFQHSRIPPFAFKQSLQNSKFIICGGKHCKTNSNVLLFSSVWKIEPQFSKTEWLPVTIKNLLKAWFQRSMPSVQRPRVAGIRSLEEWYWKDQHLLFSKFWTMMWRNADKTFSKQGFNALCLRHRNHEWPKLKAWNNQFGRVNIYCCQNFGQWCEEMLTKPSQSEVSMLYAFGTETSFGRIQKFGRIRLEGSTSFVANFLDNGAKKCWQNPLKARIQCSMLSAQKPRVARIRSLEAWNWNGQHLLLPKFWTMTWRNADKTLSTDSFVWFVSSSFFCANRFQESTFWKSLSLNLFIDLHIENFTVSSSFFVKKTNSHGSYVPSPISLSQWNGRRLT